MTTNNNPSKFESQPHPNKLIGNHDVYNFLKLLICRNDQQHGDQDLQGNLQNLMHILFDNQETGETISKIINNIFSQYKHNFPNLPYHNREHCMAVTAIALYIAQNLGINDLELLKAIAVAAAFHDVVYVPNAKDNEEKSAEIAIQFANKNNVNTQLVKAAILGTKFEFNNGDPYQHFMIKDTFEKILKETRLQGDTNALLVMICVGLADLGVYAFSVNPETNQNQNNLPLYVQLSLNFLKENSPKNSPENSPENRLDINPIQQKAFFLTISERIKTLQNQIQFNPDQPNLRDILTQLSQAYQDIAQYWNSEYYNHLQSIKRYLTHHIL